MLVATLRADPKLDGRRFIALTAYVARGMRERSIAAGFELYLTKLVDVARLLAALKAIKARSVPVARGELGTAA